LRITSHKTSLERAECGAEFVDPLHQSRARGDGGCERVGRGAVRCNHRDGEMSSTRRACCRIDDVSDVFARCIHRLLTIAACRECTVCHAQCATCIAAHSTVHPNAPARATHGRCATRDVAVDADQCGEAAVPLDRHEGSCRRKTLADAAKVQSNAIAVEGDGPCRAIPANMSPSALGACLRDARVDRRCACGTRLAPQSRERAE